MWKNKEFQDSFEQYVDNVYNYTFINSLIFSSNIRNYINELEIDKIDKSYLLDLSKDYLLENKTNNMFDDKLKQNFYLLIGYISENNNLVNNYEENSIINAIKITLNNLDNDNLEFLRKQILLRDYGSIYKFNKFKLNRMLATDMTRLKEIYYKSITDDLAVLNMLRLGSSMFYNEAYKMYLLSKNFYRSTNYFMLKESRLFENCEYLNRLRFIKEQDLDLLVSGQYDENNIDSEFYDIASVNNRLIKKFK